MTRTGQQIENDIYGLLKNSPMKSFISGEVYKYGMRPRDSKVEDAVVKFVTGLDDEIQTGVVVVNIYVPDIDAFQNGVMVRNISRCTEIEVRANEWVKSLTAGTTDYLFSLAQTIYTEEEPEINQHFVTVRIKFSLLTI
jgi:hypothetical protein